MKKLIKEKWSKMQEMSENMKRDHISESAAQCSYYTILSFIPFLILLITLIQYTGIAPQTLFDAISKIIPSSMSEMVLGIVQEVYSKSIGTISISIIFTIWTAGKGFYALNKKEKERGKDMMWYIWLSENSPLFGKDKMATFERYFLAEKETHKEKKNPYYNLLENEKVINMILKEFGLTEESAHIINGHVPVKVITGESPIKCNGKVLVIDGGFSRAYQKQTGIAGYTLIYNSYGLILAAHEPFESTEAAIEKESDIHSDSVVVKRVLERKLVGDTDIGQELKEQIEDLKMLLQAYRSGEITERM